MKAIIIAAGMGKRMGHLTDDRPKCMLSVGGRTILDSQADTLRSLGVEDVVVVRGYQGNKINCDGVRFCENKDYMDNNILESLFCARQEMDSGFVFSYSDILYTRDVLGALLASKADIAIIADVDWEKAYVGRSGHPVSEAELVKAEGGRLTLIGKGLFPCEESEGEFIGLAKFSGEGVKGLIETYDGLKAQYEEDPSFTFQGATTFRQAYLTDILQELVDRGRAVEVVKISGSWMEIDTEEDLKAAENWWGGLSNGGTF